MGKCFGSLKPPTLLIIPIILISEMPFLGQNHKIWIRAGLQHLGEVFPLNQFIWSVKGKTSPNYIRPALIQISRFWPRITIFMISIISITKKVGDINKFYNLPFQSQPYKREENFANILISIVISVNMYQNRKIIYRYSLNLYIQD